jgi:hypothetical protein
MSQSGDLVEQAKAMGAIFEVTTDGVTVRRPQGPLPSALLAELRRHKDEIRAELAKRRYKPVFPHPDQREDEMTELVRRVEEEGYVLLWSNVLQDLVTFHRDDVDPATIPTPFVPYSDDERRHLFGEDGTEPSPDTLRLIHAAKRTGAVITDSTEDEELRTDDRHGI